MSFEFRLWICWAWGISSQCWWKVPQFWPRTSHHKSLSCSLEHDFLTFQLQHLQQQSALLFCCLTWGSLGRSSPCMDLGFLVRQVGGAARRAATLQALLFIVITSTTHTPPLLSQHSPQLVWHQGLISSQPVTNSTFLRQTRGFTESNPKFVSRNIMEMTCTTQHCCLKAGWIPNNGSSSMRQKQTFKGLWANILSLNILSWKQEPKNITGADNALRQPGAHPACAL